MLLKKWLLAVVPVLFLTVNAFAGDDVLNDVAGLKAGSISDAAISIDTGLASIDVDSLASNAGKEKSTEAIEACFRGHGHNNCGYNYGSYGCYGNYNSCYSSYNFCQPSYNYCQPTYSYCQPTYTYCQPTYNYCYQTQYVCRPVCNTTCYPVYNNYWGCH